MVNNLLICVVAISILDTAFCRHMSPRLHIRTSDDIEELDGDSDKIRNVCCKRVTNKIVIGKGANGEDVEVDVGSCRQSCAKKPSKIKRKEFEMMLNELDGDVDPIEFFLNLQRETVFDSCSTGSSCRPSLTQIERYFTVDGAVEVPVIRTCSCSEISAECAVAENLHLYFPGTPYERIVDIGVCQGTSSCSKDETCKPTKNKTITIEGPNGHRCIEVVAECGCKPACYRASRIEHVYDYSGVEEQSESGEEVEPQLMTIDVGACIGSCDSEKHRVRKCVLRDPANPKKCLSSLSHRPTGCVPTGFESQFYVNKYGEKKSVLMVTHCSCQ